MKRPQAESLSTLSPAAAIVSLTAVMESLSRRSRSWQSSTKTLAALIGKLSCTIQAPNWPLDIAIVYPDARIGVSNSPANAQRTLWNTWFRTLVLNFVTRRGGILAPGASFTRNRRKRSGTSRRAGIPTLLIRSTARHKRESRLASLFKIYKTACKCWTRCLGQSHEDVALFVDPPYTGGGGETRRDELHFTCATTILTMPSCFRCLADSLAADLA